MQVPSHHSAPKILIWQEDLHFGRNSFLDFVTLGFGHLSVSLIERETQAGHLPHIFRDQLTSKSPQILIQG